MKCPVKRLTSVSGSNVELTCDVPIEFNSTHVRPHHMVLKAVDGSTVHLTWTYTSGSNKGILHDRAQEVAVT